MVYQRQTENELVLRTYNHFPARYCLFDTKKASMLVLELVNELPSYFDHVPNRK